MTLEQICDWIVLFGAVTLAITNIIKFLKAQLKVQKINQKIILNQS